MYGPDAGTCLWGRWPQAGRGVLVSCDQAYPGRRSSSATIWAPLQGDLWAQEHWRRPGGPATQATCFSVRERLAALQTITMMTASPHTTPLITAGAMAPPALDTDSQSKRA